MIGMTSREGRGRGRQDRLMVRRPGSKSASGSAPDYRLENLLHSRSQLWYSSQFTWNITIVHTATDSLSNWSEVL